MLPDIKEYPLRLGYYSTKTWDKIDKYGLDDLNGDKADDWVWTNHCIKNDDILRYDDERLKEIPDNCIWAIVERGEAT